MLSCPKTTSIFQGFYSYHIVSANVFNLLLLFVILIQGLKALWYQDGSSWELKVSLR